MERPEIYTDNYNSLEEWIELRKRKKSLFIHSFLFPLESG